MPTTTNTGPNLTMVAFLGRQAVKFGAIAVVALIVGRTLFSAFSAYWKATHPPPPPPPTVGFGLLPAIAFPEQSGEDKPASYTLETATGTTPNFGDRAKVFFMPRSSPSLLADEEARKRAANLDFLFDPQILDDRTYRWTKSRPLETTLELDIQTNRLELTTDFLSRPELLADNELPDTFRAVSQVKSYLQRAQLLPADMATVAGKTQFLKVVGGELEEAVSVSDANFIQVDLFRNPIDGRYQMYTPNGRGTVEAIVTGAFDNTDSVVRLNYDYQPIDYTQVHTYPLRSSQAAWKVLQAGEGYIANPGNGQQAVIRDIYLGYFDSFDEQDYLQPVYVFEGDDGFLGYVPALDQQFVSQPTAITN